MSLKLSHEKFLEELKKKYKKDPNEYDFSKTKYIEMWSPITIGCPIHGDFEVKPANIFYPGSKSFKPEDYRICPKCRDENLDRIFRENKQKEFIEKASKIHHNRYDYSKVNYIDNQTKVEIICPEHGSFWQKPNDHLHHLGCVKCFTLNYRKTKEDFLGISKEVHGDYYDYSSVDFVNMKTPVKIICPKHGEFYQKPSYHIHGNGCPKCGDERTSNAHRKTKEEFIEKAREVHGDKYDYSKVNYINSKTKVEIVCPIHGGFWQTPNMHISKQKSTAGYKIGNGCPYCAGTKKSNTEEFIEKARKIHGDFYDYSEVNYFTNKIPVKIICPNHGPYWQKPNYHLSNHGCPSCNESKGEKFIREYLVNHNIEYAAQKVFPNCINLNNLKFDFYLPSLNICIEYQGEQHYHPVKWFTDSDEQAQKDFEESQKRDQIKVNFCKENNIKLIIIDGRENIKYKETQNKITQLLDKELAS